MAQPRLPVVLFLLTLVIDECICINCHQCNGWEGKFPTPDFVVSTCDNRNNECGTPLYCVKIIDQMEPGVTYATFKSDCYYAINIQVNPQNLSTIVPRMCYPYQDGSYPVKKWWYCFCNDRDYCNGASMASATLPLFMISIVFRTLQ